ncbi:STAS/SEC14 domain-containing protein [Rubritalea tangerina]|uniref:STAS/SEC14 domain-containing protein n=1 Tax=Rubritalea tangerina TaxID=430798 RepID=A0ABW4Z721_9BACT
MIIKLPASEGRCLGYEISGKIGPDQERLWIADMEAALEMHAKVCVLLVLDDGAGWGVNAGIDDIKWVFTHMSKLDRIAVVSDEKIWKWLVTVDSHFAKLVGIHEKHFTHAQLEEAWEWLKGSD